MKILDRELIFDAVQVGEVDGLDRTLAGDCYIPSRRTIVSAEEIVVNANKIANDIEPPTFLTWPPWSDLISVTRRH